MKYLCTSIASQLHITIFLTISKHFSHVLLKRYQCSVIGPIKINHLFLSYSLCWVETTQCPRPAVLPVLVLARVTAWQWHVCDTSRPEYEAAVPSVTCHVSRDALDLTPTPWLETPALHPAVDTQIKHQTYGLSWLQHCSNEAGACNSAVLPTFILKYVYKSKACIVNI